jgi:hypothetical protein
MASQIYKIREKFLEHVMLVSSTGSFEEGRSWRAKEVLKLIHANTRGPVKMASFYGFRYFLLFVDDFSKDVGVFFEVKIRCG